MSHFQRSNKLLIKLVVLKHYPNLYRTFGANFEHPTWKGKSIGVCHASPWKHRTRLGGGIAPPRQSGVSCLSVGLTVNPRRFLHHTLCLDGNSHLPWHILLSGIAHATHIYIMYSFCPLKIGLKVRKAFSPMAKRSDALGHIDWHDTRQCFCPFR